MFSLDADRIEDEIAGTERPPRPRTLSGEYLMEAIEHLHCAGDPAVLYAHWRRFPPSDPLAVADQMKAAARRKRLREARLAVILTAFAGEAYVNEFLEAHGVLEDWDREPTLRKFLKGTEAAYGSPLFFTDREAYPVLQRLYRLRDLLAHPKPGFGVLGIHGDAEPEFEKHFRLTDVAEYIVMVGGAAELLVRRAFGFDELDIAGNVTWFGRPVLRGYAKRNARLPAWNAPSERQLFRQAGDFVAAQPGLDHPDLSISRLLRAKEQQRATAKDA